MRQTSPHPSKGFTLAELLISLALLGVIAAFTIPKVLQAQQNSKREALMKETIAAISALAYAGWNQGELRNGGDQWTYFKDRLNAVKLCDNTQAEGCESPGDMAGVGLWDNGGAILPSGVKVAGFCRSGCTATDDIVIDYNGDANPNQKLDDWAKTETADTFLIICNYGTTTASVGTINHPIQPGTCGPYGYDPTIDWYINLWD